MRADLGVNAPSSESSIVGSGKTPFQRGGTYERKKKSSKYLFKFPVNTKTDKARSEQ